MTFDPNNGDEPTEVSANYDEHIPLYSIPIHDSPGFEFIGWRKELAGGMFSAVLSKEEISELYIVEDLNFVAQWRELPQPRTPDSPELPAPPELSAPPEPPIHEQIDLVPIYAYLIGEDERHINPMGHISRAEAATVFMRVLTDETRAAHWTRDNPFHDIPNNGGQWYSNAVSVINAAGLMTGFPDGFFRPDAPITRAEIAMAVSRLMCMNELEDITIPNAGFTDVPANHWASDAIDLVTKYGWMVGVGNDRFSPDAHMTRAEFATLMNRVLERTGEHVNRSRMILWLDNADPTTWFYWAVQIASNPTPDSPPMNWEALQLPNAEHSDVFG